MCRDRWDEVQHCSTHIRSCFIAHRVSIDLFTLLFHFTFQLGVFLFFSACLTLLLSISPHYETLWQLSSSSPSLCYINFQSSTLKSPRDTVSKYHRCVCVQICCHSAGCVYAYIYIWACIRAYVYILRLVMGFRRWLEAIFCNDIVSPEWFLKFMFICHMQPHYYAPLWCDRHDCCSCLSSQAKTWYKSKGQGHAQENMPVLCVVYCYKYL